MRVTPKSTTSTSAATAQSGTAKSAPVSFLDMLSGASADGTSSIGISESKFQGQSGKHSGARDSDEPNKSTADAAQDALLSSLAATIPTPIEVNTLPVAQPGATTNLDATKGAGSISLTTGQDAPNGAAILASTTQIAPSLLADSTTVQLPMSFQDVAAKTNASTPSTGDATGSNSQVSTQQQPQSTQVPVGTADLSHAAKAGLQQAMADSLQAPPQANSQDSKQNSADVPTGNPGPAKSVIDVTAALPATVNAATTNPASLPASSSRGTAAGSAGSVNGISNSLRAWNSQSKISQSATNSDGKATDSKADPANQGASSNGSSRGTDNNSQQNQNSQSNAIPSPVPAKTADVVPAHVIPTDSISKPGDVASAGTTIQASDSGSHRNGESGSLSSEPLTTGASAGATGINAARVIQSMSGTEMRVGMHSSDFGEISIHTTLSPLQLQTQISVNHSELGSAIATHIPAMQAKLGSEHGVHASIEVSQTGSSLSGNPGQSSSQRNQKAFVSATANLTELAPMDTGYSGLRAPPAATEESRLDIRA